MIVLITNSIRYRYFQFLSADEVDWLRETYKARSSVVNGWFSTAVIGAFQSSPIFIPCMVVRCSTVHFLSSASAPCSWNFDSTNPADVMRVKSHVHCLLGHMCHFPKRLVSAVVGASRISRSCSLILSCIGLSVSLIQTQQH